MGIIYSTHRTGLGVTIPNYAVETLSVVHSRQNAVIDGNIPTASGCKMTRFQREFLVNDSVVLVPDSLSILLFNSASQGTAKTKTLGSWIPPNFFLIGKVVRNGGQFENLVTKKLIFFFHIVKYMIFH